MDQMYWVLVGLGAAVTLALMVFGIAVSIHPPTTTGQKTAYVLVFVALGLIGTVIAVAHSMRNQIAVESRAMSPKPGPEAAMAAPPPKARTKRPTDAAKSSTPEISRPDLATPTTGMSATAGQNLRFTTQPVAPSGEGGPFALQVIVLTDTAIDGPSLRIECDGAVADAKFFVAGQPPPTSVRTVRTGNRVFLSFGYPPFLPETPLVITLTSQTKIAVKQVAQQQF